MALVLLGGGAGVAACGSIGADDLYVDDGSTTSGTTSSTTGTTGHGGSTSTGSTSTGSTTTTSSTTSSTTKPVTCGDGKKDPGEACDGTDLGGATCVGSGFVNPAGLACNDDCTLNESGCQATCDGQKAEPGEECDGADLDGHSCLEFGFASPGGLVCSNCHLDAGGCKAACGNNALEPGETCDGTDLGTSDCTTFGFVNPAGLACLPNCSDYSQAGCKAACGNGVVEPGEACDGADLDGHTCAELGFVNPAGLKCSNACALDQSSCVAVCGNNKVEPGEQCDDGNTNNNDGCSSTCKTELLGTTCGNAVAVNVATGSQTLLGTTLGGGNHSGTGCSGFAAPDRVYALTIQNSGFLTVSLSRPQTDYDSVLYITTACSDAAANTSLLCADSYDVTNGTALDGGEVVSLRVQQGQKYFVFVDGFAQADTGNYRMVVDLSAGNCNDPVPIPLEPGADMRLLGSNNNTFPTTQGSCGGMPGGEIVYQVTRSDSAPVTVTTDTAVTNFNAALYARSSCQSGELACSNQGGTGQETITVNGVTAGVPFFMFVDGSSGTSFGNYALTLSP